MKITPANLHRQCWFLFVTQLYMYSHQRGGNDNVLKAPSGTFEQCRLTVPNVVSKISIDLWGCVFSTPWNLPGAESLHPVPASLALLTSLPWLKKGSAVSIERTWLQIVEETLSFKVETSVLLFPYNLQFMELSTWQSGVRSVTECVQSEIGQVLGLLPILPRDCASAVLGIVIMSVC